MNFYDPDGHLLDYRRIEELASDQRISLRTGCFCNPGAGEAAEGLTADDMRAAAEEPAGMTLPRFLQFMQQHNGKSIEEGRAPVRSAHRWGSSPTFRTPTGFSHSPPTFAIRPN